MGGSLSKNTVNAELVSAGTLSTNTPTTTPKGRGRPKGSLNKNTTIAEFVTADTLFTKTPTTTPKGRGRPKGSLNKFKKQNLNDVNEDILKTVPSFTIIMGGPDDGMKMPRKDGRGRPKGSKNRPKQSDGMSPEISDTIFPYLDAFENDSESDSPKRKPGQAGRPKGSKTMSRKD